jgi:colanic acid/amylovoran biosynthesis glycosyltransferase
MRIAYLVPEFPGQTHIFFWREIEALSKIGVETHIVSTRRPPKPIVSHNWAETAQANTFYLSEVGLIDALKVFAEFFRLSPVSWWRAFSSALEGCPPQKLLANLLLVFISVRLVAFMRTAGLTHVHSHSCGNSALVAMLANRLAGASFSLTLHGDLGDYGRQPNVKFRYAAFAITITNRLCLQLRKTLLDDAPETIVVAPMGVDPDVFNRNSAYIPWQGSGPLRIFSCGRLNYIKGHQELIEAVSILKSKGIDARLEIAGEDELGGSGYHRELDTLIRNLDLGERVTLLGAISEQRVYDGLCAAHLFVLASHHEPLGVAIMEAMSCGIPVVATNLGGVPELIDHNHDGYLVPPKSATVLANAIDALVSDPDLEQRFSEAGRAKVTKNFNSDLSANKLKALIAACVADRM